MSILVIDDQPSICVLLADALEQTGYAVVTATSGPAALAYLGTHKNKIIPGRVSCAPDSPLLEDPRWT